MDQKHTIVQPPKLLDQVRDRLRVKHYSIRTEAAPAHPALAAFVHPCTAHAM